MGGIPAVVTLLPASPVEVDPFAPPVVDQLGLAFLPRVLVVRAGTTVTFTNSEGSLVHNVHLRSMEDDSTVFNGDAAPGDEVAVTLEAAGGYDVLCDMHPGMTGFVYATDAPLAYAADADGRFRIPELPPGRYTLRIWSADEGLGQPHDVLVEEGVTTELDATAPR